MCLRLTPTRLKVEKMNTWVPMSRKQVVGGRELDESRRVRRISRLRLA